MADGVVELDQRVVSVWPAFGRLGKQATTMRHLLSHQAGLPTFPQTALSIRYDDREALVESLADAAPIHPPGMGVAEHALTYGHLLDEVLRRVTEESLAERFARIAGNHRLHANAVSLAVFNDGLHRPDGFVAERLGHRLWRAYLEPAATGDDLVLDRPVTWNLGLQVSAEDGRVEVGMKGAGGCSA